MATPKPETWGPQAVEDVHACVLHIRKDYPDAPLLGVGFSYGGQTMRSYMGHKQPDSTVEGFMAGVEISSMFEVDKVGPHVDGTIYDWLNTTQLLSRLEEDLPWIFEKVDRVNEEEAIDKQANEEAPEREKTVEFEADESEEQDADNESSEGQDADNDGGDKDGDKEKVNTSWGEDMVKRIKQV